MRAKLEQDLAALRDGDDAAGLARFVDEKGKKAG